jgi:hypothetical protein
VQTEYQRCVEVLLAAQSFPHLSADQLATFKARHASCAFVCRFPGCKSTAKGYSTVEARAQHEKTHSPPLVCPHSGCTYKLGFSNTENLKRHVKNDHESESRGIPRQIRVRNAVGSGSRFQRAPGPFPSDSPAEDMQEISSLSPMLSPISERFDWNQLVPQPQEDSDRRETAATQGDRGLSGGKMRTSLIVKLKFSKARIQTVSHLLRLPPKQIIAKLRSQDRKRGTTQ